MKNTVKTHVFVKFKGKDYEIDREKLKYVLDKFEVKFDINDDADVRRVLREYNLLDDIFLLNLNKIW